MSEDTPITVALVAIIALLAWTLLRKKSRHTSEVEKKLLRLCKNDAERMERLILYEQNKHHNLSREKATQYALDSFIKDNR